MAEEKSPGSCLLVYGTHLEMFWMLAFIARARYKAQFFEHVVVRCEEPFPYLFKDFADEIITYPVKGGKRDRWLYNGHYPDVTIAVSEISQRLCKEYRHVKMFGPTEDRCKRKEATWFKYGQEGTLSPLIDPFPFHILIHARNLPKVYYDKKYGNRNWPVEKWNELVSRFKGRMIASIGSTGGALHIDQTVDARGIPMDRLCRMMSISNVIVGPSSGPMHLASLCGCPHVVLTHDYKEHSLNGHTNKWRYEKMMNPFNAPCTILDKNRWNPPVDVVVKAVEGYL